MIIGGDRRDRARDQRRGQVARGHHETDHRRPTNRRPPRRSRSPGLRRTQMDDYDVIIIGTGAGGGTLARHLAPSGQADPAARARRLAPARARELVGPGPSSSTTATSRRTPGTTTRASRSSPVSTTSSAARRSCTAPRSTGCGRRTSASSSHHDGISPAWPISLRRARALLHEGRAALPGTRRPRRGPDRAAGERAVPAPGGVARAADPAARRRPRGRRLPPVPRALRDPARRGEPALQHLHPLRDLRRLPVPRPREVRRRGARRAPGARASRTSRC